MSVKKALINPPTLTLLVALPLFFAGVTMKSMPAEVVKIIGYFGDMTAPMCMIILGMRFGAAHCMNKTPDEIKNIPWATKASVTKATYSDGIFKLIEYGKDDFMGELVKKIKKNV